MKTITLDFSIYEYELKQQNDTGFYNGQAKLKYQIFDYMKSGKNFAYWAPEYYGWEDIPSFWEEFLHHAGKQNEWSQYLDRMKEYYSP